MDIQELARAILDRLVKQVMEDQLAQDIQEELVRVKYLLALDLLVQESLSKQRKVQRLVPAILDPRILLLNLLMEDIQEQREDLLVEGIQEQRVGLVLGDIQAQLGELLEVMQDQVVFMVDLVAEDSRDLLLADIQEQEQLVLTRDLLEFMQDQVVFMADLLAEDSQDLLLADIQEQERLVLIRDLLGDIQEPREVLVELQYLVKPLHLVLDSHKHQFMFLLAQLELD